MNILVIRFSSLGDVLLTIPVFKTLEKINPETKYYLLTRPSFKDFFISLQNVEVIGADIDHQFKGVIGLTKLANHLKSYKFDILVDLHDVLRTQILRKLLHSSMNKIVIFDKGRKEKKAMIAKNIPFEPLPHTCKRYLTAFDFMKGDLQLINGPWLETESDIDHHSNFKNLQLLPKSKKWIGIAPFSKHESKEWLEDQWLEVIKNRISKGNSIFVFAFGEREKSIVGEWQKAFNNLVVIDEKYSIPDQLALIKTLDIMLSVDSGNMHLASLMGTKVISIWLSTHPYLGFGPLENEDHIIQPSSNNAPWRPLSVYGKLKSKQDQKLNQKSKSSIKLGIVLDKLEEILKL